MNADEEPLVEHELNEKYAELREEYRQEQEKLLSLNDARKNKLNLFEGKEPSEDNKVDEDE